MSGELSFGNHAVQNRDTWGDRKDSVTNAERTGEFVWNMATYDLREAVNRSAQAVGPEIDEFALAGVTKAPSILVNPPPRRRIPHPVRLHLPNHPAPPRQQHRPIARLGYYDYTSIESTFTMAIPGNDPAVLAGLEGRPLR